MRDVVEALFDDQETFFEDWGRLEPEVMAALELVSVTSFAVSGEFPWSTGVGRIRTWKVFTESAARLSLTVLAEPAALQNQKKWIQSISSIEVSLSILCCLY